MKKHIKIVALILASSMFIGMLPGAAFAGEHPEIYGELNAFPDEENTAEIFEDETVAEDMDEETAQSIITAAGVGMQAAAWTGVISNVSGGTSWPQMAGVPNSNPNLSPNADQVVTLSWPATADSSDEYYTVWYGETANVSIEPETFEISPATLIKNEADGQWSAATTIKSGTAYWFYVTSSERGMSNTIIQAPRNGNIGPDALVEIIDRLPADPSLTDMSHRYDLVRIRRIYQKLTAYDRSIIAEELRHFEICEAYWLSDWVKGVYEQFDLAPGAAPSVTSDEYAKWRAAAELILSREGTQWFMRWGSADVHEYGHNVMSRNDPELRAILLETGATARLDRMDALRDEFVEERKELYRKVKDSVEAQIAAMDPEVPAEVADARAAYDALTPYERTFVTNLVKLLNAEERSIVPPNIVASGMRQSTYSTPNWNGAWPVGEAWGQMNARMKEHFPETRSENIWIVGALSSNAGMDFGGGSNLEFTFESLLDKAPAALVDTTSENPSEHTYKGKTQAQWLRDGVLFDNASNARSTRHDSILAYFNDNEIYVYLSVEAGFADMAELIDMCFYRYGDNSSVIGFAIDCEWHMGNTEDSGIQVTDEMARTWNLTMKAHNPAYRMALKDYEATRLPWNYRGEPGEEDLIFCIDAQSFGDLDGTTVGYYEANGAWYEDDYWYGNWRGKYTARDGAAVGNQPFYHDWSVYFYPNDVCYQFGYTGDRHWMGALDIPFDGLQNTPYPQYMSSLIAWQAPMDQKVGIAWVNFNLNGFTGFPEIFNTTPAALGGQVNTALGLLAQSGSNWIGQRFTNPDRDTLYGGGPVLNDAMYVARMRAMVNEADEKEWTGISDTNRARLTLLEPLAIDVRIEALPPLDMLKYGHRFTVDAILSDYNALTEAQKEQVANVDVLMAAKNRIDELAIGVVEVESLIINQTVMSNMKVGTSQQLTVTITPEDAINQNITWASLNTNILQINGDGVLTAVKPGMAIITATAANGVATQIVVRVTL